MHPAGQARLDLSYIRDRVGTTRPDRAFVQPPLQLSRVRYDQPQRPEVAVQTLLLLGGILAGDRQTLHVELAEETSAQIVMAAATQILSMLNGYAEQYLNIQLGSHSRLDWLAEPTILFADAAFHQHTSITLSDTATLVFLDILVPGRLARGEIHHYRHYQNTFDIRDEHQNLLVCERQSLEPKRLLTDVPGVLGQTPVVGSLYMIGKCLDAARLVGEIRMRAEGAIGASLLPNQAGLLVRTLGPTASDVRERLSKLVPT